MRVDAQPWAARYVSAVCGVMVAGLLVSQGVRPGSARAESPAPRRDAQATTWLDYASGDPNLPVAFQYPSGWRLREERGVIDSYRLVRLLGPRNPEDTYTAYLVVRVAPLDASTRAAEAVDAFFDRYLDHLPDSTVIDAQERWTIAGVPATALTVSYTIPTLDDERAGEVRIPVTTRTIVMARRDALYEFVYSADTAAYPTYETYVEQLLKSFSFQE